MRSQRGFQYAPQIIMFHKTVKQRAALACPLHSVATIKTWVLGMALLICMTLALRADNFHSPFPVFPASCSLITDHHTSMVAKLRNVLEQMQSLTKGRNGAL